MCAGVSVLESCRAGQQASEKQESYERGFSFPEDGGQLQECLELGSGMKRATTGRGDLLGPTVHQAQPPQAEFSCWISQHSPIGDPGLYQM